MLQVEMTATVRDKFGKGAARSLRRSGLTPAVVYGPKAEAVTLSLETRSFVKKLTELHGRNAVVTLNLEGGETSQRHVLLQEIQKEPVRDTLVHADFYEISLEEEAIFSVPLKYVGTAKGVDLGGMLHVVKTSVQIKGLPLDIPDFIEQDVTPLTLGGPGIHCSDLAIPGNVTILDDGADICVSVVHLKRAEISEGEEEELEEAASEAEAAPAAEA